MKYLNSHTKLLYYFLPAAAALAGIAMSIFNVVEINNKISTIYRDTFIVSNSIGMVNDNFEQMRVSVLASVMDTSSQVPSYTMDQIYDASAVIQEEISGIKDNFPGDTKIVEKLQEDLKEFVTIQIHIIELISAGNKTEADVYMEQSCMPKAKEIQGELDILTQAASEKGLTLITALQRSQVQGIIILTVLCVICLFICIYLSASIVRQMKGMKQSITDLNKSLDHIHMMKK